MISPAFKYILIAIVGVVILLFFISFAFRHASSEEALSAVLIAQTLDDTFETFTMSPNLATEINFNKELELNIDCNKLSLKNQRQVDLPRVIFSPRTLKGSKISTFTQEWDAPFKITNFYYLTNSRNKVFLVYDSQTNSFVEEINKTIPAEFRTEMIHFSTINQLNNLNNYDNVKLVFFNSNIAPKINKITRIQIEPKEQGTVTFLDESRQITDTYISKEMLLGAIFSEDSESYKCTKEKAIEQLGIVADIYIEKTDLLSKKKTRCNKFDNIIRLLRDLKDQNKLTQITTTLTNLISSNRELAGDRECVEVF